MTIQYVEDGWKAECTLNASKYLISNFSPWFILLLLLLGSVSIKGRIHLHSETIVCDHRLRAPTRAVDRSVITEIRSEMALPLGGTPIVMRFG